jgi:hypothetical protein
MLNLVVHIVTKGFKRLMYQRNEILIADLIHVKAGAARVTVAATL